MISQVTKDKKTGAIKDTYQYTYNEHGYLASEKYNGKLNYEYTYEYDAKGNWIKRNGDGYTLFRKITYWN